jgi:hypothetical protein
MQLAPLWSRCNARREVTVVVIEDLRTTSVNNLVMRSRPCRCGLNGESFDFRDCRKSRPHAARGDDDDFSGVLQSTVAAFTSAACHMYKP